MSVYQINIERVVADTVRITALSAELLNLLASLEDR